MCPTSRSQVPHTVGPEAIESFCGRLWLTHVCIDVANICKCRVLCGRNLAATLVRLHREVSTGKRARLLNICRSSSNMTPGLSKRKIATIFRKVFICCTPTVGWTNTTINSTRVELLLEAEYIVEISDYVCISMCQFYSKSPSSIPDLSHMLLKMPFWRHNFLGVSNSAHSPLSITKILS